MAVITTKKLINLLVKTESGINVGWVIDIEIDIETQKITAYCIKPEKILTRLFNDCLIIKSNQVISINNEAMIVDDNTVKDKTINPIEIPA